jgi:hypothetical protein
MPTSQSALQDRVSLFKLTQGAATFGSRVLVTPLASLVVVSMEVVSQINPICLSEFSPHTYCFYLHSPLSMIYAKKDFPEQLTRISLPHTPSAQRAISISHMVMGQGPLETISKIP